jgi:hypothetical protein
MKLWGNRFSVGKDPGSTNWKALEEAMQKHVLIGENAEGNRVSSKRRSTGGRDDMVDDAGIHKFFIKTLPNNRITPMNCRNHRGVVTENRFELHCLNRVNQDRCWVYTLEKRFRDGTVSFNLTEKDFHFLIVNLKPGFVVFRNKRRVLINQKVEISIRDYHFEGSV